MKKALLFVLIWITSCGIHAAPLPAAEAFHVKAELLDPNSFKLSWQIKPGYFLYSERIHFSTAPDSNADFSIMHLPNATVKTDKHGRHYKTYRHHLSIPLAVLGKKNGESIIELRYQGCSDDGFCYPPEKRQIKLNIDNNLALTAVTLEKPISLEKTQKHSQLDSINDLLKKQPLFMIILTFFGFGLLLSLTPCVLPMVPVLYGIIIGHGSKLSTHKAFLLSLSYVVAMSATYALVGAVVALLGKNLQIIMQSPWVVGFFSLVFIALAFSMFGYYELRIPVSWQTKLANANRQIKGGHYLGAAAMGCLSTLILSPCVTAPFIGALGYIARSGHILSGSLALFALGFGMGLPLLFIGASTGKWLPKAGRWMSSVNAFFGLLLLAVAIHLLGRILLPPITMALWASLLIFTGIYCGALTQATSTQAKFYQGLGLISLLYGLLILIGVSMGNTNPLQPLAGLSFHAQTKSNLSQKLVKTLNEAQQALALAYGKPVFIDFYADWCASCQKMEAIFQEPKIQKLLKQFVLVKVDITANNEQTSALLNFFNVIAPPTFLFFNKKGLEETDLRLVGEISAQKLLHQLHQLHQAQAT